MADAQRWTVALDPPQATTNRTELNLNSGHIAVDHAGIDWGESAIRAFLAEQQFGEAPTDYRIPNRIVSIPLFLGSQHARSQQEAVELEEQGRRELQEKVALFQRQGGVLLRQRGGHVAGYEGYVRNRMINPNFEYTAMEPTWLANNPPLSIAYSTATVAFGTHSLKIENTAVSGVETGAFQSPTVGLQQKVTPGKQYNLWLWMRSNSSTFNVTITVYFTKELSISFGAKVLSTKAINGTWTRYSTGLFTAPALAEGCQFEIQGRPLPTNNAIYLDNLLLIETASAAAPEYVDGDSIGTEWQAAPGGSMSVGPEPLYADIVNATLMVPDQLGETAGVEPNAILKLECLPDFYGEEMPLDQGVTGIGESEGNVIQVLKQGLSQAFIKGDYPARTRMLVKDSSAAAHRQFLWGLRSRRYDSAATAALAYFTNTFNMVNGGSISGKSGSWEGKNTARILAPQINTWIPFAELGTMTHVGTYRVWARAEGQPGQQLRLSWHLLGATESISNTPATVAFQEKWQLLDLGVIRIPEPLTNVEGSEGWTGTLDVNTGSISGSFWCDRVWLQPIDDGAGELRATASPRVLALTSESQPVSSEEWAAGGGTQSWVEAGKGLGYTDSRLSAELSPLNEGIKAKPLEIWHLNNASAIPTGAEIKGIEVTVPYTVVGGGQLQIAMIPIGSGVRGTTKGAEKRKLVYGSGTLVFGGPSDLWGTTWTPAEWQLTGAGFFLTPTNVGPGGPLTQLQIKDTFSIRIYYSTTATSVTQDAVVFASSPMQITTEGSVRASGGAYSPVSEQTGQLPRLPPSGLENRPCELFSRTSPGRVFHSWDPTSEAEPDEPIRGFSIQLFYRPCYIGRI